MSTTSLKLSDEIKAKAANAAKELGISAHAFMVEAIRQATVNTEYRSAFIAEAKAARETTLIANEVYESKNVFDHLRSRISGKQVTSLKAKSW
jgi:predicted transcriptional regulator